MTADDFVRKKVAMWVDCVEKVFKAATKSPQAAYNALSKSLQCEWLYLQQVMHNCGGAFVPLQVAILKAFYQAFLKEICQMLNVNCFLYQLVLLAWGSIILQKLHHRPTTPLYPGHQSCGRSY